MKTFPMSDTGFASHQPESKVSQMIYAFFHFLFFIKDTRDKEAAIIFQHKSLIVFHIMQKWLMTNECFMFLLTFAVRFSVTTNVFGEE